LIKKKVFTANFRRFTKHDLLADYLMRFKIQNSNVCDLCEDGVQTSEHLFTCEALADMRAVLSKLDMNTFQFFSKLYFHVRELKY